MLRSVSRVGLIGLVAMAVGPQGLHGESPREKIRVLIVTGGHDFEREAFFELFRLLPDVTFTEVRHPDAHKRFAPAAGAEAESDQVADDFDVIVLYDLWQDISEQAKKDFVSLLRRGKGLLALHHCIASYQKWPEYEKIIGAKYHVPGLSDEPPSSFKHGCEMKIHVAEPDHPVVAGIKDFTIHDEAYLRMRFSPDVKPLLTTDHPDNDPAIAWARRYGNARVAYIQLGHDSKAYGNESYRTLVGNAIRWVACRSPEAKPDKDGFVSLFDGKTLDGWVLMGEPDGFFVKDGVIRSEGRQGRWLRLVRQYSDFVLKLEWRVAENGNSGVFLRAGEGAQPWLGGIEVQITNAPRDDLHCTGSLYGVVAPNPRPDESADKWHAFEIRCEGPRIAVAVDGVGVVNADCSTIDALKSKARRGYIGLQDSHARKGCWIEYRNIRLKDLASTAPRVKDAERGSE
ncbi:MAG: DUF1080 domain-containing protein [Phycisphaerae bacterium]|nr:DUF1080 domain-containing protein [Phycisphaerae bacterium]